MDSNIETLDCTTSISLKPKEAKNSFTCKTCFKKFTSYKKCIDHLKRKCINRKNTSDSDKLSENDSYDENEIESGFGMLRLNSKKLVNQFQEIDPNSLNKLNLKDDKIIIDDYDDNNKDFIGKLRKISSIKLHNSKNKKVISNSTTDKDNQLKNDLKNIRDHKNNKKHVTKRQYKRSKSYSDSDSSDSDNSHNSEEIDYNNLSELDVISNILDAKIFYLEEANLNSILSSQNLKIKGNKDSLIKAIVKHYLPLEKLQYIYKEMDIMDINIKFLSYINELLNLKYQGLKLELIESLEDYLYVQNFNPLLFSTLVGDKILIELYEKNLIMNLSLRQIKEIFHYRTLNISNDRNEMLEILREYLKKSKELDTFS